MRSKTYYSKMPVIIRSGKLTENAGILPYFEILFLRFFQNSFQNDAKAILNQSVLRENQIIIVDYQNFKKIKVLKPNFQKILKNFKYCLIIGLWKIIY